MTRHDELVRLSARLASHAGDDEETGLCNLRQFFRYLARELVRSCRTEEVLRIVVLECRSLTRISHQLPAAADDAQCPAAFSPIGMLDGPQSTPALPSGQKPHRARRLGALATKPGEKCGLTTAAEIARGLERIFDGEDVIARIGQLSFAVLRCGHDDDEISIADELVDIFGPAAEFAVGERRVDAKDLISFAAQPLFHDALLALERAKAQGGNAHYVWPSEPTIVH